MKENRPTPESEIPKASYLCRQHWLAIREAESDDFDAGDRLSRSSYMVFLMGWVKAFRAAQIMKAVAVDSAELGAMSDCAGAEAEAELIRVANELGHSDLLNCPAWE